MDTDDPGSDQQTQSPVKIDALDHRYEDKMSASIAKDQSFHPTRQPAIAISLLPTARFNVPDTPTSALSTCRNLSTSSFTALKPNILSSQAPSHRGGTQEHGSQRVREGEKHEKPSKGERKKPSEIFRDQGKLHPPRKLGSTETALQDDAAISAVAQAFYESEKFRALVENIVSHQKRSLGAQELGQEQVLGGQGRMGMSRDEMDGKDEPERDFRHE